MLRKARLITTVMALALAVLLGPGCGGDGPTDPGGSGGGDGLTAKVNGASFSAEPIGVTALGGGGPGAFVITGAQTVSGKTTAISIVLNFVSGPGTFPLGVLPGTIGGIGTVGESGSSWITEYTGSAGSVTITTLTPTRIVGTFSYTAEPGSSNPSTEDKVVTAGRFNVRLKGTIVPVPDHLGNKATMKLNGTFYNASLVTALTVGASSRGFSSSNTEFTFDLSLADITATGTYSLSATPFRYMTMKNRDTDGIWTSFATPQGTVVVTHLSATRIRGTFSAVLNPQAGSGATGTMTVSDGVFDIGTQ